MPKKSLQTNQTGDFRDKLKELFAKAQAKVQTQSEGTADYTDKRILKFKSGTKYRVRLLFYPGDKRDTPFINTYIHSYYDPQRKKYGSVICPTSEIAEGSAGFDSCPICTACNAFWNSAQMGDKEAEIMYRKFRSRAQNYAVVYVVSSTEQEEVSTGQFKIIKYGFEFARFFQQYIFGVPQRNMPQLEDDEIVGYKAFDLEAGYDLIISVGTKDTVINGEHVTFNDYNLKFANSVSAVNLTEEDIAEAFKELKFDEDFYKVSTKAELDEFFNTFINTGTEDLDTVQSKQSKPQKTIVNKASDEDEDVPYDFEDDSKKDKFNLDLDDDTDKEDSEFDDDWGDFEIPD